ncbi:MAG: hypothetical protein KKB29_01255, partial [Nanoarchaeota archaeon]|nr:hypothetical protein [Nanoarchaeota archaeon]
MAKGIIFDLGEVYFQIDWEAIDGEMKQKFGISSLIRSNYGEDINKIYDKSSVGELSLKDVFEKICEDQNLDAGEVTAYYKELYKKFKKVNLDVADLIKKLKGNVKVACFTDTNDVHLQTHREQNHLDDFDYVFASCELGKVKKEEGAFDKMLQEMNLEP